RELLRRFGERTEENKHLAVEVAEKNDGQVVHIHHLLKDMNLEWMFIVIIIIMYLMWIYSWFHMDII
ncbi:MAG: hypothetical protein EZS28_021247, partial [Streblomastix strix]